MAGAVALSAPAASLAADSAEFEAFVNGTHVCEISVSDRTFSIPQVGDSVAEGSVLVEVSQNGDTYWELSPVDVVNSPDPSATEGTFVVDIDGETLTATTGSGDGKEITGEYLDQNTEVTATIEDTNSALEFGEYRIRTVLTCVAGEGFEPPAGDPSADERPNSGAGNGGEGGGGEDGDSDPGNSGGNNNAPDSPPGQSKR